jgi:hypothetical protein
MKRLANGTRVKTTQDAGADDWCDPERLDTRWGVSGTIVRHSDSHALCYLVKHDCDGEAWYEEEELRVICHKYKGG